ncbi:hypothetical protein Tco_0843550 [Tanacetum coccineum]|uniref:Uncharacterized protein n=1 Tax=Tanacetum coccineum TaxID=301880 RepID=A0ABQ5B5N5_9ASTR
MNPEVKMITPWLRKVQLKEPESRMNIVNVLGEFSLFDYVYSEGWKIRRGSGVTERIMMIIGVNALKRVKKNKLWDFPSFRSATKNEQVNRFLVSESVISEARTLQVVTLESRFGKPDKPTASISLDFPNQISHEQSDHMEREVSNDEIKKSVWECGDQTKPREPGWNTFGGFILDEVLGNFGLGKMEKMDSMFSSFFEKGLSLINGSPTDEFSLGRVDVGVWVNLFALCSYADDAVFIGEVERK